MVPRSRELDVSLGGGLENCVEDLKGGITDKTKVNEAAGYHPRRQLLYGDCKSFGNPSE